MATAGSTIITFGKYRGKTFDDVRRQHPGYVQWARGEKPNHGQLADFVLYCNEVAGRPSNIPEMPSKRVADMPQSLPSPKRSRSDVDVPRNEETNESHSCEKCGALDLPSWAARCTACWRLYFRSSDSDFYLRCPIEQKDEAKKRGAAFDFGLKKWYVPAGKDISKCEKWFVRCVKCKEGLSDHPKMKYDPTSRKNPPQCDPECEKDRLARVEAEQREQDRKDQEDLTKLHAEEAEKRRLERKESVKKKFLHFLRDETGKIQKLIKEKQSEGDTGLVPLPGRLLEDLNSKIQRLEDATEGEVCDFFYNPFREADEDVSVLSPRITSWLRSFGTSSFHKKVEYAVCTQRLDFQPQKILDWALTFFHFFLPRWVDELGHEGRREVKNQQDLIAHLLLQTLDPVTPDLKLLIQERLKESYQTTCPDVVAIFGSKIMPRIRKAVGDEEFERLNKGHLCILCVVEYMSNRKKYHKEHHETEETTKMRDILTVLAEELLKKHFGEGLPMTRQRLKSKSQFHGAPLLCREVNEAGTDALYFANPQHPQAPKSAGRQCFMLREPNTKAVDLFSLDLVSIAARQMKRDMDAGSEVVVPPSMEVFRSRIFALFRKLHFRIDRKLTTGTFARYGLDEGLREADQDKRVLAIKENFPALHEEMLQHHWSVRDFVGFKEKRLHSNSELIQILLSHLDLNHGPFNDFVQDLRVMATKRIEEALALRDRTNEELRANLPQNVSNMCLPD